MLQDKEELLSLLPRISCGQSFKDLYMHKLGCNCSENARRNVGVTFTFCGKNIDRSDYDVLGRISETAAAHQIDVLTWRPDSAG